MFNNKFTVPMQFDEIDEEIFQSEINNFVEKYGSDALKGIYHLHRNLSRQLFVKNLPTTEIFRRLLYNDFDKELNTGKSLNKIAERICKKENVSKRFVYDYFNIHYPRIKKLRKDKTKQKTIAD